MGDIRSLQLSNYRKVRQELARVYTLLKTCDDNTFTKQRQRWRDQIMTIRAILDCLKLERLEELDDMKKRLDLIEADMQNNRVA